MAPVAARLTPDVRLRVFSNLGAISPGAKLYTYLSATSTPASVYTDATSGIAHANPVVADSSGLFPAIFLAAGTVYRFTLTDSTGATIWGPEDGIDGGAGSSVALGGTGVTSLTAHGVLIGEGTSPIAATSAGTTGQVLTSNGASADPTFQSLGSSLCEGRITLTTGLAVTIADVTAAATVYFTPYKGNHCALYDGAQWQRVTFTEKSLALGTDTTGKNYDLFGYLNAGTLALERLVWTNDSTRATTLTLQDGQWTKTGDATRLYLGTYRTTGAGQTEDSLTKRFVWNQFNRVPRNLYKAESTASWAYTTKTWRQARATATNQVEIVIGIAESQLELDVLCEVANDGVASSMAVAIGLDSTTAPSAGNVFGVFIVAVANGIVSPRSHYVSYPAAGYHYAAWLEISTAAGVTTWLAANQQGFGEVSGIVGSVRG